MLRVNKGTELHDNACFSGDKASYLGLVVECLTTLFM